MFCNCKDNLETLEVELVSLEKRLDYLVQTLGGGSSYISTITGVNFSYGGRLGKLHDDQTEISNEIYTLSKKLGYKKLPSAAWIKIKKGGN